MIAHVDKLKPWQSDSLPKSWLEPESQSDDCASTGRDLHPEAVNNGQSWQADPGTTVVTSMTVNGGTDVVTVRSWRQRVRVTTGVLMT